MVSISTRVPRRRLARIRAGRLDAVEPGMRMSISTTSGRQLRGGRRPPGRRPPPRRRPRCRARASRIIRNPARTSAWSSASSTRIVTGHAGSRARTRKPPRRAARRRAPRRTARPARASRSGRGRRRPPERAARAPVVRDLDLARARLRVADADRCACAGARVPDRVGQGLLDDPVGGRGPRRAAAAAARPRAGAPAEPGRADAGRQVRQPRQARLRLCVGLAVARCGGCRPSAACRPGVPGPALDRAQRATGPVGLLRGDAAAERPPAARSRSACGRPRRAARGRSATVRRRMASRACNSAARRARGRQVQGGVFLQPPAAGGAPGRPGQPQATPADVAMVPESWPCCATPPRRTAPTPTSSSGGAHSDRRPSVRLPTEYAVSTRATNGWNAAWCGAAA